MSFQELNRVPVIPFNNDGKTTLLNGELIVDKDKDGNHTIKINGSNKSLYDNIKAKVQKELDEAGTGIYGFDMDMSNSNMLTNVSYVQKNATYLPIKMGTKSESEDLGNWKTFLYNQLGCKPCLLKNGKVIGYLMRNDYSKFEDGTSADITSGDLGDVMIEFNKLYYKFEVNGDILSFRVSQKKVDSTYQCAAFLSNDSAHTEKAKMYLSAYYLSGSIGNGSLYSLSNKDAYTYSESTNIKREAVWYDSLSDFKYFSTKQRIENKIMTNRPSNYTMYSYTVHCFFVGLYIMLFKSPICSYNYKSPRYQYADFNNPYLITRKSGLLNSSGLFNANSNNGAIKFFGVEGLFGVRYDIYGRTTNNTSDGATTSVSYRCRGILFRGFEYDMYNSLIDPNNSLGYMYFYNDYPFYGYQKYNNIIGTKDYTVGGLSTYAKDLFNLLYNTHYLYSKKYLAVCSSVLFPNLTDSSSSAPNTHISIYSNNGVAYSGSDAYYGNSEMALTGDGILGWEPLYNDHYNDGWEKYDRFYGDILTTFMVYC